jgi:predicted DNA-binding WGR domain protein
MPTPIRLINDFDRNSGPEEKKHLEMDMGFLEQALERLPQKKAEKYAYASDGDAALLFDLWKRSDIVHDAENAYDKHYSVPSGFSNDDILRLKSASLIAGEGTIRFLPRAVSVIKTMVLSEDNEFGKKSEKKPYSLILAEMKSKFSGGPRLALGSTMVAEATEYGSSLVIGTLNLNEHMKTSQVGNIGDIPPEKIRDLSTTVYSHDNRLIYRDERSDKEYVVRVFGFGDGTYATIAFNGRTGRNLTPQPKYYGRSVAQAEDVANAAVRAKERKGYERADITGEPPCLAPGISQSESARRRAVEEAIEEIRERPARPERPPRERPKKVTKPGTITVVPKPEPEKEIKPPTIDEMMDKIFQQVEDVEE